MKPSIGEVWRYFLEQHIMKNENFFLFSRYLNRVARHPILREDPDFRQFLEADVVCLIWIGLHVAVYTVHVLQLLQSFLK